MLGNQWFYVERTTRRHGGIRFNECGCIKFDLKSWDESLHLTLTGVSNRRTVRNFKDLAESTSEGSEPPFLIASTLMVPGYIDTLEVGHIAEFIASINPEIPYSLLAFHP
jgi:pyruvate formate lyase activating enzyme